MIGILLLVGGIGLLRERPWARTTVLVIEVLGAIGDLVAVISGAVQNALGIVLAAIVIGLLLSRSSRAYFAAAR